MKEHEIRHHNENVERSEVGNILIELLTTIENKVPDSIKEGEGVLFLTTSRSKRESGEDDESMKAIIGKPTVLISVLLKAAMNNEHFARILLATAEAYEMQKVLKESGLDKLFEHF